MMIVFFALLLGFSCATASQCPCQDLNMKEEIDWYRMSSIKTPWYDAVDIPGPPTAIDCWNWDKFTPVENGVVVELSQWVEGGQDTKTVIMHFIRVQGKKGVYTVSHEHKQQFAETSIASVLHKADDDMIEEMHTVTDALFSNEFFFITDYDNYFIPGACNDDASWSAWIKFRRPVPTPKDILQVWNAMVDHKICGHMQLKEICFGREYIDECER